MKFSTFLKKGSAWSLKSFGNYWLWKKCFSQCQKSPVSENPSGVKVFAGTKHSSNPHGIIFILIFLESKTKWVRKHLSQSDLKCKDCLLTRWRLITCILLIIEINPCNQFKRNYLRKQKQFLEVLFHFWNLHEILHILKRSIRLIAQIFLKLLTPKNVLCWMPKSSSFRTPFSSQSIRGSQTLLKSTQNSFYPNFPLI